MAITYEPITTTTLGSAQLSVTFSSISSAYTDLVLVCNFGVSGTTNVGMRLNGDTGSNYSATFLDANGTSAVSGRFSNQTRIIFTASSWYAATAFTNTLIVNLADYLNTTTYKTSLTRFGSTDRGTLALAGLWRNTTAITSLEIFVDSGNTFSTDSTFTLYGIKAA